MAIAYLNSRKAGGLLALLFVFTAGRAAGVDLLPETWEARRKMVDAISGPPSNLAFTPERTIAQSSSPHNVRFRIELGGDSVYLLFMAAGPGGRYSLGNRGNVSIKRSYPEGALLYMTFLLNDRLDSYVRVHPAGDRSSVDVVFMDSPLYRNVPIPVSFDKLATQPFERIVETTRSRIDWDLLLVEGSRSSRVEDTVTTARSQLPLLTDEEDGAFDADGSPVLIATGEPSKGGLNCSGFAKWIVDGFYYPLTGHYTKLDEAKRKHGDLRGNRWSRGMEELRDPYFGLDWSRNLAGLLYEARYGRRPDPESLDVRRVPFLEYIEDVGYRIEDLELALYYLAVEDPDRFFIASINREYGSDPILHQHTHVALLFPMFDEVGRFHVVVMERNVETGVGSLRARYPATHIHLVEVSVEGTFSPLTSPSDAD
jgi:hypothetical protein